MSDNKVEYSVNYLLIYSILWKLPSSITSKRNLQLFIPTFITYLITTLNQRWTLLYSAAPSEYAGGALDTLNWGSPNHPITTRKTDNNHRIMNYPPEFKNPATFQKSITSSTMTKTASYTNMIIFIFQWGKGVICTRKNISVMRKVRTFTAEMPKVDFIL